MCVVVCVFVFVCVCVCLCVFVCVCLQGSRGARSPLFGRGAQQETRSASLPEADPAQGSGRCLSSHDMYMYIHTSYVCIHTYVRMYLTSFCNSKIYIII